MVFVPSLHWKYDRILTWYRGEMFSAVDSNRKMRSTNENYKDLRTSRKAIRSFSRKCFNQFIMLDWFSFCYGCSVPSIFRCAFIWNFENAFRKVIDKWWEKYWSAVCPFTFRFSYLILEFWVNTNSSYICWLLLLLFLCELFFSFFVRFGRSELKCMLQVACRSIQMWTKCENNWWLNALSLWRFFFLLLGLLLLFQFRVLSLVSVDGTNRDPMHECAFILASVQTTRDAQLKTKQYFPLFSLAKINQIGHFFSFNISVFWSLASCALLFPPLLPHSIRWHFSRWIRSHSGHQKTVPIRCYGVYFFFFASFSLNIQPTKRLKTVNVSTVTSNSPKAKFEYVAAEKV